MDPAFKGLECSRIQGITRWRLPWKVKPLWKQGQNSPNKTHDLDQLTVNPVGLGQGLRFGIRIELTSKWQSLLLSGIQSESKPSGPHPPLVDLMINGLKTWSFHLQVFMCRWKWTTKKWRLRNGGNRSLPTIVILGIFCVKHVGL